MWELLCRLGEDEAAADEVAAALDEARAAYVELYEDAEAIARSSIVAGRRTRSTGKGGVKARGIRVAARVFPEALPAQGPRALAQAPRPGARAQRRGCSLRSARKPRRA